MKNENTYVRNAKHNVNHADPQGQPNLTSNISYLRISYLRHEIFKQKYSATAAAHATWFLYFYVP